MSRAAAGRANVKLRSGAAGLTGLTAAPLYLLLSFIRLKPNADRKLVKVEIQFWWPPVLLEKFLSDRVSQPQPSSEEVLSNFLLLLLLINGRLFLSQRRIAFLLC